MRAELAGIVLGGIPKLLRTMSAIGIGATPCLAALVPATHQISPTNLSTIGAVSVTDGVTLTVADSATWSIA